MSQLTVYGASDLDQIIAAGYAAAAGQPANIGTGSQFGPSFRAVRLAIQLLQNENVYIDTISRLGTIQDPLDNGLPNPDFDSFVNPFGWFRPGSTFASGYVTFTLPQAPLSDVTIPVGTICQAGNGVQFAVVPGGTGYSAAASGYIILAGTTNISALVVATTPGSMGNVLAGAIDQIFPVLGGPTLPPSITCSNAVAFTNGIDALTGQPARDAFSKYIAGGGAGTPFAIMAATIGTPGWANILYSYGDQVSAHQVGTGWAFDFNTPSWFTLVVNIANQGTTPPPSTLMAAVASGLLYNIRPAGISFLVVPPNLQTVAMAGTYYIQSGYDVATVGNNLTTAATNFVNGIGLDHYGNQTVCSLMQSYVALSQVPGIAYIDGLTLNGGTADVFAPFGNQLVAGAMNFQP